MEMLKDTLDYIKFEYNNEITKQFRCSCCGDVIEPHSWYYVSLRNKGFTFQRPNPIYYYVGDLVWLHKFCGELPMMMRHPSHQHLLKMNFKLNSVSCAFCKRSVAWDLFKYSCSSSCNVDVHPWCAVDETSKLLSSKTPTEIEKIALKDLIHHHKLQLMRTQSCQDEDDDDDDQIATIRHCKACQQPIIDSTHYICTQESQECKDYYLHRFCGELPVVMKHEWHPLHPLMLILCPPPEHFKCFACGNFCKGIIYSCRTCNFQLDIICATTASRILEHKGHPHPLMLLPRPSSSFCYACCRVHEGLFYHCSTCMVFLLHQDCASHAYQLYHSSHEGHPLRLGYQSDGQHRKECDLCYMTIYETAGWFYYCWECKFYAHLNCIMSEKDKQVEEIDGEIPTWPWEEADNEFGTVVSLNRELRNIPEMDMINHFSHPDHPLILQTELPRVENPYSDDGEIALSTQCNGCCKQISAPLYSCAYCHFYIHKVCALLPTSIANKPHQVSEFHNHSKHDQSRLHLVRNPWDEIQVFKCDNCYHFCNGFFYQCEEKSCSYKIDVECAFLPETIVHKSHPFHRLQLVEAKSEALNSITENRYKCCSKPYSFIYSLYDRMIYKCGKCRFVIHARCAMYPGKAHHRYDCERPFMLCYNPSKIQPNEHHYCDICEETLDPKKWFYFSSKTGGQIMHPKCLLFRESAVVANNNIKSISSLIEGNIHAHPLHLYPNQSSYNQCNHCERMMTSHNNNTIGVKRSFDFAFKCVEWGCQYQIHVSCANKIIQQVRQDTQQTLDTGIESLLARLEDSTIIYSRNEVIELDSEESGNFSSSQGETNP